METLLANDIGIKPCPREVQHATLWLGIDVGSTTVKIAAIDPVSREIVFWRYMRHNACQVKSVCTLLELLKGELGDTHIKIAACGSGAEPIAEAVGGVFVQEVIATSIAIKEFYPRTKTAIELGGQDAKILFLKHDTPGRPPRLADMRMNGCCAGGTGAFIDQIAVLLKMPVEQLDEAARKGKNVFDISGRCGVFAKTDLQPLLNMAVSKEDIALSAFHAVAKQVITGLGYGTVLQGPVAFLGGPFHFNRELVRVFSQHLGLLPEDVLLPPHPQVMAALGAALALGDLSIDKCEHVGLANVTRGLSDFRRHPADRSTENEPFFRSPGEMVQFRQRHASPPFVPHCPPAGTAQNVYIGIDAGSTTIKFVLMDERNEIVNKFYASNCGDPVGVVKKALLDIYDTYRRSGVQLFVRGLGATGYGESLIAAAFGADFHTVETIAHAHAALHFVPDATFVLDLGGQDMKAMRVRNGVICDLYLNEACSAGCGSFIETLAVSLNVPVEKVADLAFLATSPSALGSRCTVFMNSSITTEQKNGKTIEDIMAGLCRSVIDNLFTKVIRDRSVAYLGDKIVVQGGTFKNDAVLRAFEQRTNATVIRPHHAGEMGALGIALLTKESLRAQTGNAAPRSSFIGFEALRSFACSNVSHDTCGGCANSCKRTILRFSNGSAFCAGNRCEKGNAGAPTSAEAVHNRQSEAPRAPSMVRFREAALFGDCAPAQKPPARGTTIGIPRVLEFYHSFPYWKALFCELGFSVVVSPRSSRGLHDKGIRYVASDTICFPAKIAHGHIEYLLDKKVDRIFAPLMVAVPSTTRSKTSVHMCPVVQGYPIVLKEMNEPHRRAAVAMDSPAFQWHDAQLRRRQVRDYLLRTYSIGRHEADTAIAAAEKALASFGQSMLDEGRRMLATCEADHAMAVVLAGRPYHYDAYINHGIAEIFSSLGIPLFTLDSLPGLASLDLRRSRTEPYNPFHSEILAAGLFAARHPCLEVVQLVSFGCGHDAILSDELCRIMHETCGRQPLILKIDESDAFGALKIRIRSFVETARGRRA